MKPIKCVVWDLDNTLWSGVLLEDGGVCLKPLIKEIIQEIDRRGILQSVSSKNSYEKSIEKLKEFGLDEYFLYPQINWNPKSDGIIRISRELNINLDTFIFIDDQEFELKEVGFHYPQVILFDAENIESLLNLPEMVPSILTAETSNRRKLYKSEQLRKAFEADFRGTSEEFLKTLKLVFTIKPASAEDLIRAEELTIRTNQLNTTGYTYSLEELWHFISDDKHELLIASLEDVYGDYGKIGLALYEKRDRFWNIKLFLMSCRVMSRGVGNVFLSYLVNQSVAQSKTLRAEFVRNDVNEVMYVTYKMTGFDEINDEDITPIILEYKLGKTKAIPSYISLNQN